MSGWLLPPNTHSPLVPSSLPCQGGWAGMEPARLGTNPGWLDLPSSLTSFACKAGSFPHITAATLTHTHLVLERSASSILHTGS